jgi:hypothetical protein
MERFDSLFTERKLGEGDTHLVDAETDATFNWLTDFDVTNLCRWDHNLVATNVGEDKRGIASESCSHCALDISWRGRALKGEFARYIRDGDSYL